MYFKVSYDKRKGNLQLVILLEYDDIYIKLLIGELNDNKSNSSFLLGFILALALVCHSKLLFLLYFYIFKLH
jgi:hypothetical protein